jgi:hypothetical protein
MNRRALFISLLTLFLVLLAFNSLRAVGKPDVTSHEATFLGSAVNMHIEWQSPNPIVTVRISIANKQQDIKVDPYDNRRNPSGYAGEVNVTIGLDMIPNQPFNYVIQLEDELRMKSELVTGKVKVPASQYPQYPQFPQYPQYPQQPGMIMPSPQQPGMIMPPPQQPGIQSFPQPGIQPGVQPGGQQVGELIVIISPQIINQYGALWRVENGPWKKSGESIPNLPVGMHTIEFQDIGNWIKPQNLQVMIEAGLTHTINGVYSSR